jgi:hypothetical protein
MTRKKVPRPGKDWHRRFGLGRSLELAVFLVRLE